MKTFSFVNNGIIDRPASQPKVQRIAQPVAQVSSPAKPVETAPSVSVEAPKVNVVARAMAVVFGLVFAVAGFLIIGDMHAFEINHALGRSWDAGIDDILGLLLFFGVAVPGMIGMVIGAGVGRFISGPAK